MQAAGNSLDPADEAFLAPLIVRATQALDALPRSLDDPAAGPGGYVEAIMLARRWLTTSRS